MSIGAHKFRAVSIALAVAAVSACAKPIILQKVTLIPRAGASGEDATGSSYLLIASIRDSQLREIVRNQLHAYIFLERCDNGRFVAGVLPKLDGTEITAFEKIDLLMKQKPKPVYSLSGTLVIDKEFVGDPICATLSGGGYTFVKIRRQKVPVDWIASG